MTLDRIRIGVDVGGTLVRVGVVNTHGVLLQIVRFPTPVDLNGKALTDQIVRAVASLRLSLDAKLDASGPDCVGLALPGLVDRVRGFLVRSFNLSFLESRPIVAELTNALALPVFIMTDAEAATWGEYTASSPRPRGFVHLRLGTGIAVGVVQRGVLVDTAQPTRQGHLEVLMTDHTRAAQPCLCGNRGCLETIASGRALVEQTKCAGLGDTLTDLHRSWVNGDPRATKIGDSALAAIGVALRQISMAYAPELICIGGGVIAALPRILDCILGTAVAEQAHQPQPNTPQVVSARWGDHAGVIGAALLAGKAAIP